MIATFFGLWPRNCWIAIDREAATESRNEMEWEKEHCVNVKKIADDVYFFYLFFGGGGGEIYKYILFVCVCKNELTSWYHLKYLTLDTWLGRLR